MISLSGILNELEILSSEYDFFVFLGVEVDDDGTFSENANIELDRFYSSNM